MAGGRRSKWPSARDLDLFHAVVADVTPLRPEPLLVTDPRPAKLNKKPKAKVDGPGGSINSVVKPVSPRSVFPAALADHDAGRAPGLDRRSALRLQRGKTVIDGRIDLHGMTQSQARSALSTFVTSGHRHGHRCLLVITGKGRRPKAGSDAPWGSEPGILRRMVPNWLEEPPIAGCVLAYSPAQPEHGGSGALYVLLKRRRDQ
jgi:DNA-nicking Smr family endonuclease